MAFERIDSPRCLIPQERLASRVKELAKEIEKTYAGKGPLVIVCALRGAFVFFSDLIREIPLPLTCDFLSISEYREAPQDSGEVKITMDLAGAVKGKHVLLVEDVVDSGQTLQYLLRYLEARRPASLRVCTLFLKSHSVRSPHEIEFIGFQLGDEYVVGYGMDFESRFRGLPYIGVVDRAQ